MRAYNMIEYEHEGAFKEPLSSDKRSRYEFQSTGGQPQFRIPIRSDSVRFREAMAMDPCVPKLKVGSLLEFCYNSLFPQSCYINQLVCGSKEICQRTKCVFCFSQ